MSEARSTQLSIDAATTTPPQGPELPYEPDSLMTRLAASETPPHLEHNANSAIPPQSSKPPSSDDAIVVRRTRIISIGGPISAFVAPSVAPPSKTLPSSSEDTATTQTPTESLNTIHTETSAHEDEAPVLSIDSIPAIVSEDAILNADDVVEEVTAPQLKISVALAEHDVASNESEDLTNAIPPPLPSTKIAIPPEASPPTTSSQASSASITTDTTPEARPKKRPWFEDLFNDDFIRTLPQLNPTFLAREVAFIESALSCQQGATILDLCCGQGQHALSLAQQGYNIVGLDLSLSMLTRAADEAAEKKLHVSWVHSDMRELDFKESYDGVYCWGTSFGFFEESKNVDVIQKIQHALRRGGRFLLDVINRDYVLVRTPSMVWFEGEGCVCMDESVMNIITSRLTIKRTMMFEDGRQREIEYSIRLYSLHELGKILHDAGFRVIEASGDISTRGVHFGAESPRILILAEKR